MAEEEGGDPPAPGLTEAVVIVAPTERLKV